MSKLNKEQLDKIVNTLTANTDQYATFVQDQFNKLPPLLTVNLFVTMHNMMEKAFTENDHRMQMVVSMAMLHFAGLLIQAGKDETGPFKGL